uniref:Uncharacterized protein n=1 Tax=Peronospora matthiolae TaxID=2874970 RepID=A0AAV1V7I8_9STRA
MRCAAEAARKAATRMRADEERYSFASAAGDASPAVANSPRDESPRATDTSATSAAGTANRNVDKPGIDLIYSGELDDASGIEGDTSRLRIIRGGNCKIQVDWLWGTWRHHVRDLRTERSSDESSPHASPYNDRTRGDGGDAPMHHHEKN